MSEENNQDPPAAPPVEPPKDPPKKKEEDLPKLDLTEKPNRLIEDSNLAAKRMEEATAAQKIENDRTQALIVEQKLGGEAAAGQPAVTEDQKNIAASKKLLEGTGFEDMLDEPEEPAKFTNK